MPFGFGSAIFAFSAVALGAVPIIIHLLNRRRFKVVPWAAMEFLLSSHKKNYRRIRLEQLILLALRVLAMLLLGLALARPYLEASGLAGTLGMSQRYVVLIVDRSFSMGHTIGGKTAFERATTAAERVLESLKPGDKMSLIAMTDTAEVIIRQPTIEYATAGRSELMRLTLSDAGTNIPAALRTAVELLDAEPTMNREVVLITDCRRGAWQLGEGQARAEMLQITAELNKKARATTIIDVGHEQIDNLAITSLLPDKKLVSVGPPAVLAASVQNFGDTDASAEVTFLLDGFKQSTQQVPVAAGDTATVSLSHVFRDALTHTIEARLAGDNLAADDRRYLAVQIVESLRVLLVDGEPGNLPADSETFFIRTALHPTVEDATTRISFIDPTVIRESELGTANIDESDIVVLANVGGITQSIAARLEAYAADGGSVLIFLGDRLDALIYNDELHRDGQGLLPAKLGDIADSRAQPTSLAPKDFSHRLMATFKGEKAVLLSFGSVYRYFKLSVDKDATVVCPYGTGDAGIVEKPFGNGRVMMFATSADTEWTDLPKTGTFVIMMQDLARHLARDRLLLSNVTVGDTLHRALPPEQAAGGIPITPPGANEPIPVTPVTEAGRLTLNYKDTDKAGVYEVELTPPAGVDRPGRTDSFAVNVDPRESSLRRIGPQELRRALKDFKFSYIRDVPEKAAETNPDASRSSQLWRHLLYAMLAILCMETFLAQAFGRR